MNESIPVGKADSSTSNKSKYWWWDISGYLDNSVKHESDLISNIS